MSLYDVYTRIQNSNGENAYLVDEVSVPDVLITLTGAMELGVSADASFSGEYSYSLDADLELSVGADAIFEAAYNKTVYVRTSNGNGSTVASESFYYPESNSHTLTASLSVSVTADATFTAAYNKTAYVRVQNGNGFSVASESFYYPYADEYSLSANLEIGVSASAYFLSLYSVIIDTPHANITQRLASEPDIEAGDIIEWGNVQGGTSDDVQVFDDGTYEVAEGVTAFDWRVISGGDTGAWTTESIEDNVASLTYSLTAALEVSADADAQLIKLLEIDLNAGLSIAAQATASFVGEWSYSLDAALEIGAEADAGFDAGGYSYSLGASLEIDAQADATLGGLLSYSLNAALDVGVAADAVLTARQVFATTAPIGRVLRFR